MIRVKQAIVVEGRYDKNTLRQLVDAPIIETNGFGILSDREKLQYLRRVAEERGLVILTDPDGAGFVIRNYLKGALPKDRVLHAYVPDIAGKERRKRAPGKEGKLGVEGMSREVLLAALKNAGAELDGESAEPAAEAITRQDFYDVGLTGGANSRERRKAFAHMAGLPEHMSTGALLDAVNLLMDREHFYQLCGELSND